ncbi:hypothetical protein CpB0699 [Chlamydia pneumoniae TW-183]|uniref:Uncharacterized protein n=3 Tax=Chlamydia pneumoniae TaxID=83558 RepID=A0A0F7WWE2_CHLPN|nr:hypothetical protein CpB0699 [Chlamydia pneumoniae TW-183]CRI33189.1 Uncharacterized protein BN1224_Wien1_A_06960 [Chlamydia pneumoniae]CRI36052.1 Uncharacterized protein BN1224_CM1_A_06990 [Chlamydia pneumoniae]CRI37179.1 Uncharacterized protein BN1224_CV14_A_06980 [Chlamydia pneumoniae]CRI38307.1 Uncharacterized protein BN1224_CV15_C_01400 [Chlamydia pneumoniae]
MCAHYFAVYLSSLVLLQVMLRYPFLKRILSSLFYCLGTLRENLQKEKHTTVSLSKCLLP